MIASMGQSPDLRALPAAAPLLDAFDGAPGVWVVGGAVRDLLLGLGASVVDLDLVVEGDAVAAAGRLAEALGGELVAHERFGTAAVRAGGHEYDFAPARAERYARPGALPEIRPAALEEDLPRRDFTVNAIALGLDGRLVAAPGALTDLDARVLRVFHDASFVDDPTRLLRLVRYATRLGFAVEPGTRALAEEALASGALSTVSPARIGGELRLLLREPDALRALAWVGSWEGLGLELSFDASLASHALALLPGDGRRDLLLLGVAVHGLDPSSLSAWLDALEFAAGDRAVIVAVAQASGYEGEERASAVAARFRGQPVEAVALAGALGPAEPARRWLMELRHLRLEIDGSDLLAAGVPQGEAIGRGLAAALRAKLDGEAPDRDAELAAALAAT
jgi:tRNA nucleotidyltransferase (CCA-adding enzyme)